MTEANIERLVKMANQIALNMAANGTEEEVAEQIAQHLGKFWPPSMKDSVQAFSSNTKQTVTAYKALLGLQRELITDCAQVDIIYIPVLLFAIRFASRFYRAIFYHDQLTI